MSTVLFDESDGAAYLKRRQELCDPINPPDTPIEDPQTLLTPRQLRPFVWIAWLGVATTALNTLVPLASQAGYLRVGAADLDAFRDIVLLVHAPATLLPLLALALLAFRHSAFAAILVVAFTLMEKFIEFAGQVLQIFPPEETLGGVQMRSVVDAIWDQMFFVLWFCNTLGATAAGLLMFYVTRSSLRFIAAGLAWAAAFLTLTMLLGPDYVGWSVPTPTAPLFFVIFTSYRIALALTLARSEAQSGSR